MAKFITQSKDVTKLEEFEKYKPLLSSSSQKKFKTIVEKQDKPTFFQKVVSVLSSGETGNAVYNMLQGKNPVEQYGKDIIKGISGYGYDKRTYADVLENIGMKRTSLSQKLPFLYSDTGKGLQLKKGGFLDPTDTGSLGLAMDILGDPTTYMGGAGIFKRLGKGGKNLTKAGKEAFDQANKKAVRNLTKRGISDTSEEGLKIMQNVGEQMTDTFKKDPDKYFKGVTFMGQEIVPRKLALGPGRYLDRQMGHIPIANTVYDGIKGGIQDAFLVGASVIRKGKQLGEIGENTASRYLKSKDQAIKQMKFQTDELFNTLKPLQKNLTRGLNKEERQATFKFINDKIETGLGQLGVKGDKNLVDGIIDEFEKFNKGFYGAEKEAAEKLNQNIYQRISGYMPHQLSEEGKKALAKKNVANFKLNSWRNWSSRAEKGRNLFRFVDEAGNFYNQGTTKNLGLKEFNKLTEEKFLQKQADKLVNRRQKEINSYLREIQNLTKKQIREAVRPSSVQKLKKVMKVRITPKGTSIMTKLPRVSPTGLPLYRKGIKRKPSFDFRTAELTSSETKKFVEQLIRLPKNEILKLDKQIKKIKGKKIPNIGKEINDIKNQLGSKISDLPDAEKWFKTPDGKVVTINRTMSIPEINDMMSEFMEKSGQKGKNFLSNDPFELIYARGKDSAKKIAMKEHFGRLQSLGKFGDETTEYIRNPKSRTTSIKKTFNDFTDPETGIRYVNPKMDELPDGLLLPDFIVDDMKKTVKMVDDGEVTNKLLKMYDKVIHEWKGSVYGWYPASHGRNLIGGGFNNFLGNPKSFKFMMQPNLTKKILKGKDGAVTLSGKKYSYETLRKQIGKSGILGQTGYLDINELNKTFNPSVWKQGKDLPMKGMELVENNLRVPLFLAELDSGKTVKQAADTVFKYHFDYAPEALTSFEKNVMKRLIPFYKWNRENIPLMMEEFIVQPGKMLGTFKLLNSTKDSEGKTHEEWLPSWIEKEFAVGRGGETTTGFGLPPLEMLKYFQEPGRGLTGGATPFLKVPVELMTNYNTFKDKQISEDTSGFFAENYPQIVKDFLEFEDRSWADKEGKKVASYKINPLRKYWLYALPLGRLASIWTATAGETEKNKLLRAISGIRTYEFDMERLKSQKQKEFDDELLELMKSAGIHSKFGTPYKSSKEALEKLEALQ